MSDAKIKAIAPEDVRGVLAIGAMLGFFAILVFTIYLLAIDSIGMDDVVILSGLVSPIAMIGFGFYFGQKSNVG